MGATAGAPRLRSGRLRACCFFFSSRGRHTRCWRDWSSDVCSPDLPRRRAARDLRRAGRPRGGARLNVTWFASSLVSSYWNGAATYYRGIVRALHERGHRVTFYEPDAYQRQQHRDIADPDWARVVVYPGEGEEGVLRALESARGADLVVKASGVGVFDELLERAVLDLRRPGALVAFWDVDAP